MITRRKLIGGIGLLISSPAIVRVADLMPIKAWAREPRVFKPVWELTAGDTLSLTFDMAEFIKGDEIRIENIPPSVNRLLVNTFDSKTLQMSVSHFDGVPSGTFYRHAGGKFMRTPLKF